MYIYTFKKISWLIKEATMYVCIYIYIYMYRVTRYIYI